MKLENFNAKKLTDYLAEVLESRGLNMRQVSLQAGLNPGTVSSYMQGKRPHRDACLLLAEAMGVNPNDLLVAAGYKPLPILDRSLIDPAEFPPDVKEFAAELSRYDWERRREIMAAVRTLLKG